VNVCGSTLVVMNEYEILVTHLIINGYSVIAGEMEYIAHEDEYEKEMT